jgi:hypothetical protein
VACDAAPCKGWILLISAGRILLRVLRHPLVGTVAGSCSVGQDTLPVYGGVLSALSQATNQSFDADA